MAGGSSISSFDPATWRPPRRELIWRSPLNRYRSFGLVGRELLFAAVRAGIDVTLASPPPRGEPDFRRLRTGSEPAGRIGFSLDYLPRPDPLRCELLVVSSACEGTLVARDRVEAINRSAALLCVPCRQNRDTFAACGVRVPIALLPHGIDPARFPALDRPRPGGEPYTFGTFGALSARKGVDLLVRAFGEEFAAGEPVRLLLKSVDAPGVVVADPRIRLLTGYWNEAGVLGFLRGLDAFVLPSRAEGFGLCALEAMATGLPVIATDWGGPADYLDPADSLPLAYRLVDAAGTVANGVRYEGQWAEPDLPHLRRQLRWLYEHREEGRRMGQAASVRVHGAWTWDHAAARLRDDLDQLAGGVSPA